MFFACFRIIDLEFGWKFKESFEEEEDINKLGNYYMYWHHEILMATWPRWQVTGADARVRVCQSWIHSTIDGGGGGSDCTVHRPRSQQSTGVLLHQLQGDFDANAVWLFVVSGPRSLRWFSLFYSFDWRPWYPFSRITYWNRQQGQVSKHIRSAKG